MEEAATAWEVAMEEIVFFNEDPDYAFRDPLGYGIHVAVCSGHPTDEFDSYRTRSDDGRVFFARFLGRTNSRPDVCSEGG